MLSIVTPASSSALTTLANVKAELGISGTGDDTHLTNLIARASAACARWCARTTFGAEVLRQTERLVMPRGSIVLDRDLAAAVTGVSEDDTELTTDDYELDGSLLFRLRSSRRAWWPAYSTIVVDYTAGYSLPADVPADVEQAAILLVSSWFAGRGRDPLLRSESVEGVGQTSWLDPRDGREAMPPQAAALLEPWRNLVA